MSIRNELREILNILADLSKNDAEADVMDNSIYEQSNRPKDEVDKYLNELSSLELISQRQPKPHGVNFRLFHITGKGLLELNQDMR